MQYIVYVSAIRKDISELGSNYAMILDSQELDSLKNDLALHDYDMTGAMVWIENGDYKEIYVTEDSRPYAISCTYHKVIRYYRNQPSDDLPTMDNLPHGSGINSDWKRIDTHTYANSYEHMNEYGFYDCEVDFTFSFSADMKQWSIKFPYNKTLRIADYDEDTGKETSYNILPEIKEYLDDTFSEFVSDWLKLG